MGWLYMTTKETKSQALKRIVAELNCSTYKVIAHKCIGKTLWAVMDHTKHGKFILCVLIEKHDGCYGTKDIPEEMGPNYYNCPLKFLDMAPVTCEKWRESVKKFHERANMVIEIGATYTIRSNMWNIKTVKLTNEYKKNKFDCITDNGMHVSVRKNQLIAKV